MGNATQFLTGVPFHSPTYHILLYGINQIGPKIEEFMESEGNNFALGPKLLWDENGNLPKVLIRRCEALPPDAIDGMIAKSAAMPSISSPILPGSLMAIPCNPIMSYSSLMIMAMTPKSFSCPLFLWFTCCESVGSSSLLH